MAKFLYPENRLFVTGKAAMPVNHDEILNNIYPQIDELRHPMFLVAFLVVFCILIFLFFIMVKFFMSWEKILTDPILLVGSPFATLGIIYMSYYLYNTLKTQVKFAYHPKREVLIVEEMVKDKKLIEGKIISINIGQENKIRFSYNNDNNQKIIWEYIFDNGITGLDAKLDFDIETDSVVVLLYRFGAVLL